MTKTRTKHIHKFKRHTYTNGEQVFFCVLDCKFKINVGLAIGKVTICNRCGKEFALNENSIRLAKPHCTACTKGAKKIEAIIPHDITGLRSRLEESLKAIAGTKANQDFDAITGESKDDLL